MTTDAEQAVRAEKLWRSYRRGAETVHALADLSLEVDKGQMLGIVGRSGSGKTTFLNQVGCLDRPTGGKLWIAGQDVTQVSERDLVAFRRDHIGFVFQLFYLIPTLSAIENIRLPLLFAGKTDEPRAQELAHRVGLDGRLDLRPSSLSGGDRQRVAIARALVNDPKVLLADEPTGRLESKAREEILDLFDELGQDGLTIIMATHDLAQAGRCDRVVKLRDGRIVV